MGNRKIDIDAKLEPIPKLLCSTFRAPAVLGLRRQEAEANSEAGPQGLPQERHVILRYLCVCSGSCAPATRELSSLATF